MYEEFFNLKEKPFNLTPDTRFFFPSTGHDRVLAYLRYGIREGEGFIVVTGDIGAGKTTLIHMLLDEIEQKKRKDLIIAHLDNTQPGGNELLAMVADAFGLQFERLSKAALLSRLRNFLNEQMRNGKRAILILDEVQHLSHEGLDELRMLTNFLNNQKPMVQGFLVGQIEFRAKIQSERLESLKQRIIASCHLGPLEFEETKKYIEHRLSVAGWDNDPSISPESFTKIHNYTSGIPRRINTMCDRIFLVAYIEELHEITPELVDAVIEELQSENIVYEPIPEPQAKQEPPKVEAPAPSLEMPPQPEPIKSTPPPAQAAMPKTPPAANSDPPSFSTTGNGSGGHDRRIETLSRRIDELQVRLESIEDVMVMVRAAIRAVMTTNK